MTTRTIRAAVLTAGVVGIWLTSQPSQAIEGPYRRHISYQSRRDLFYNFYEGPLPNSTTAHMYVSPTPVPPRVGHTYTTYQPLMPHEYLYAHKRSHYGYTCGAGWTRAKVRYKTTGLWLDHLLWKMNCCY